MRDTFEEAIENICIEMRSLNLNDKFFTDESFYWVNFWYCEWLYTSRLEYTQTHDEILLCFRKEIQFISCLRQPTVFILIVNTKICRRLVSMQSLLVSDILFFKQTFSLNMVTLYFWFETFIQVNDFFFHGVSWFKLTKTALGSISKTQFWVQVRFDGYFESINISNVCIFGLVFCWDYFKTKWEKEISFSRKL